jgi:Icc-related predicted phosphoesterase
MKILAISDEVVDSLYSPRIKEKYADVDLVLGCGDLPFYYLEFIVTMLDVPLYYVPGNHDKPNQYMSDGRVVNRAEGCEPLDGRLASRSTLLLAGLGGCLRYNADASHQYTQGEMQARVMGLAPALLANRVRYGRFLDVFISHAPPRGIHDGPDLAHTGFDAFLKLMDWFQPRFWLHGHSHVYRTDAVTATRYKQTVVLNVYPCRVIEW